MSKILCPSLRLGYIVAPEPLVDSFVKIRSAMDQHSSPIDQAIAPVVSQAEEEAQAAEASAEKS